MLLLLGAQSLLISAKIEIIGLNYNLLSRYVKQKHKQSSGPNVLSYDHMKYGFWDRSFLNLIGCSPGSIFPY